MKLIQKLRRAKTSIAHDEPSTAADNEPQSASAIVGHVKSGTGPKWRRFIVIGSVLAIVIGFAAFYALNDATSTNDTATQQDETFVTATPDEVELARIIRADTGKITSINTDTKEIGIAAVDNGQTTFSYSDSTNFTKGDFLEPITITDLAAGAEVNISYNIENKKIFELWVVQNEN